MMISSAFTAESSPFLRNNRNVRSCFIAGTSSLLRHHRHSSINSAYLPSPIVHRRSQSGDRVVGDKGRKISLVITNSYRREPSDVVKDIFVDTLKLSVADLGKFIKDQPLAIKILAILTTGSVAIASKMPPAMWQENIKKLILFLSKAVEEAVPWIHMFCNFVLDPKVIFLFVVAVSVSMGFVIGSKSDHLKGKDATRVGGSVTESTAELVAVAESGDTISYYFIEKVDNLNVYNSDVSKSILPPIPPSGV